MVIGAAVVLGTYLVKEELREGAQRAADSATAKSTEFRIESQPIQGISGTGYLYNFPIPASISSTEPFTSPKVDELAHVDLNARVFQSDDELDATAIFRFRQSQLFQYLQKINQCYSDLKTSLQAADPKDVPSFTQKLPQETLSAALMRAALGRPYRSWDFVSNHPAEGHANDTIPKSQNEEIQQALAYGQILYKVIVDERSLLDERVEKAEGKLRKYDAMARSAFIVGWIVALLGHVTGVKGVDGDDE